MARRGKGATGRAAEEGPNINCDSCRRWVYLDETPFDDLKAATDADAFTCKLCKRLESLEIRLKEHSCRTCTALQTRVEDLEKLLQELAEKRNQQPTEQANVTGSEGDLHTPKRSRGADTPSHDQLMTGLMAGTTYSTQEAPPDKEPATPTKWDASQQCLKSQHPAMGPPADTQLNLPGVKQHENPGDTEKHSPDKKPHRGERRTTEHEEPPSQPRRTSVTGKRDKQHETGGPRFHRNSQICPLVGVQREMVLVGDGNVDLVAETVMAELGSRAALEFISGKGVTAADAIAYANKYEQGAEPLPRKYILHAGLHDVLKGTPEEVAQALDLQWTGQPGSLIVCSIPEIYSRGGETRAAVVLANAKIKKWCRRTGNRFLDLGKGELSSGFQKDGLHYNEVTARQVGRVIGTVAAPFLGLGLSHRREKTTQDWRTRPDKCQPNQPSGPPHWSRAQTEPRLTSRGEHWHGGRTGRGQRGLAQLIEEALENVLAKKWPTL